MAAALGFLYTPTGKDTPGVRVLRVFGDTPCPVLPGSIAGLPVREIGPYCFAAREVTGGRFWSEDSAMTPAHPLCGEFVQGVTLPQSVRVLHSAAFYNCRALQTLTLGTAVEALGSDLFTNCRALQDFVVNGAPDAPTGLKKLLGAVSSDITVRFSGGTAKLFYPEYFEWLDENTPAHIFNRSIEGEGYRYRQCFGGPSGNVLRFYEYDKAFAKACGCESKATLCRIALYRLQAPFSLSDAAKAAYLALLAQNGAEACALALALRDADALLLLAPLLTAEARRAAALQCGALGWSKGAALLLGRTAGHTAKRYDF